MKKHQEKAEVRKEFSIIFGHFQLVKRIGFLALLLLAINPGRLLAAPHFGEAFTYRQPDGETFQIHLYGDEFFAYQETADGYLVIRDPNNGLFCYAKVTPDGADIISTGVRVGQVKPAGLKPKQRLAPGMAMRKSLGNRNLLGVDEKGRRNSGKKLKPGKGREILNVPIDETSPQSAPGDGTSSESDPVVLPAPPSIPTLNQRVGLVLLVSFPDLPGDITKTVADIDDYCNAEVYTAGGNATSIYGYFKIQSNGKLSYKNNVTAWFTAANPRSYYTDETIALGSRARDLIKEGLAVLKAQGFDFTQCDGNNDGVLDGVNIFYAGVRTNAWSKGLWPHQSGGSWTGLTGTGLSSTSYQYQITDMPSSLSIGTFCHENGHMICDFPDLYSYGATVGEGSAANMGAFSLMASSGSTHPRHVDPYLKIHAGWADVVDLTSASQLLCAVQQDRNFFYRYKNPAKSTEYFLFEVRGNAGYEGVWNGAAATNPANGLVVYHALEGGSNTYSTIITADTTTDYTKPYELMVVEALPSTSVIPWYDDPTPGTNDAFTASGVSSVSDSSNPVSLKFWAADGRTVLSGANINTVSAPGATMTFIAGSGSLPADPVTSVTATQLQPNADFGENAANHSFSVFNSGGGTLSYTVSDDAAWLSCTPASGTATTEADVITVAYSTTALAAGSHTATISINGGSAGNKTIGVTLTVNPQPTLNSSPGSFALAGIAGTSGPVVSFDLSNTGGGTAAYTITKTQPWLTLDRTSGTVSGELDLVTLTFDATTLARGVYTDTITVASAEATNSPLMVPVSFTVDGADMIITAPNGGEQWTRSTTQTITWVSGIGGNVAIELLKNGVYNSTISASTPNDGSYAWSIPSNQTLATNYRMRVTSVETPAAFDEGFADFAITPPPIYSATMDTNPGWSFSHASWAYGQPTGTGQDGYGQPDPTSGFNGPNVIGYRLDGDYEGSITSTRWATTPAINCSNRANVTLSFQRWLGVESSQYDHAYIQVSNNGNDWTEVWQNTSTTMEGGAWEAVQYDISAVADGQSTVYIRWGMGVTDGSWNYCGWNIDDVVIDGDYVGGGAGIVIAESGGSTGGTEGAATDTYSIALASQPTADVTITVAPDSQVSVSPTSLTFTTSNWATPQNVTVTAVNDSDIEVSPHTGSILHTAVSSDADYNGASLDGILVNVTDNDNNVPVVNAGPDQFVFLVGSTWSPLGLAPKLWLDADDDATITLNGATVSQWDDKSGFNRHATAASTSQPTATAAGLNGKRVLTFDGSTDVLNVDLDFLAGVSHSTFIVAKPTTYSNIYGAANGSAAANSLHVGFSNASNYRMNYWGNDYAPVITANFRAGSANVLNYVWTSGASKQIYANGSSEGTNGSAGVIGTMSGGGRIGRTTGHAFFGGDIAEFIAITGGVSAADRESIEGYLAHKWGLTDWLPTAHPYKTNGPNDAEAIANLDGTTSDLDGHSLTTLWTVVSGPAPVTLGDTSSVDTTVTFTTAGVYTLRLTADDGFTQISDDVVITVNPAGEGYNVTYAGNGSTGGSVPVDSNNPYIDSATVTVLGNTGALVRSGYTFSGWNTAADSTGTSYDANDTFTISGHTTLYAQWSPNNYTVTFDKQSGSGGTNNLSATFGLAMPSATAPSRAGYAFGGYYTQVSGAGVQYYTAAMASARSWDIASNTTLYALWVPNSYTVTFNANGGDAPSPTSKSVTYNSTYDTLATVTRTGYTFEGWFTAASGGIEVTASSTVTTASDHTLYAQWTASVYTVAYNGNGNTSGTAPSNQSKSHDIDLTLTTNSGNLAKTNHVFVGWNSAADGSGTHYAESATYAANASITLFAEWQLIGTLAVTADGLTATGSYGGSFSPSSKIYTLSNIGSTSINWETTKTQSWVTLSSPTSGTLAAGANTTVTVSINSNADSLGVNAYSDAVTFTNTSNGLGNTTRAVDLTVASATATVTLGNLSQTYNGSPKSVSVTTDPASLAHSVTYDGSTTAPTNAGTYAVVATITDPNYTGSDSGDLVIAKASQTITFAALDPVTDEQASFDLTATATSGLSVSYASSNTDVATVSGSAATVVGLGSTTITASQTGDANYESADSVPRSLSVVRANPLANPGGPYKVLIGQSLALIGSASEASYGETISTYEWDLNNDNTFGDLAGATPAAISFDDLVQTWGMIQGLNTIQFKITDSSAKTSIVSTTVELVLALNWDANAGTADQTNGGGEWLGASQWWDGAGNQTWAAGSNAAFGGPNTAGGAVTLASPTMVNSITFNTFTDTYTLGTTGQTITLNGGIDKTSTSAAASFVSPIILGGAQTWINNSTGVLATANGTNLIDNAGYDLTIDGSGITNFGVISNESVTITGSGALVKNGTGRLNAGGVNSSFTGTVTINGGVLHANNNAGALGNGNVEFNGGVLSFYWGTTYTRTLGSGSNQVQIIGGDSGFAGSGTTGPTINLGSTIVWGALGDGSATGYFNPAKFVLGDPDTGNAGAVTFSTAINLNGVTRTIVVPKGLSAGGNVSTISGVISSTGTAGLIKEGNGTLVLSVANTYIGNTTISGGNLRIGNNTAGSLNGGNYDGNVSIASGATLQIWSSAAQTLSGTISGDGDLNKAYGGALTLSGPNTYTGRTSFLPQSTSGCTINITSFNSVNGGTPLLASSSLGAPTTIANGMIDIGNSGKQASVNLNYTGSGETTDRVLNFGFNGSSSQTLTSSGGGLLKFTSAMTSNATTQSGKLILAGTGNGEITQTLPALPTGGLTKNGTGTWTLGGANSYSGPTAITAGKLFINGDQTTATGNVSVSVNATLGGTGVMGGSTTIADGGKLEFAISTNDASHNSLDVVAGKDFIFSGTSVLTITSSGGASVGTYTLVTGGNAIGGTAPASITLPNGWEATVSISGNSLLLNVTSTGATPSITAWPTAASIIEGQALSFAVLSGGSASVPGSFAYDIPSVIPGVGTYAAAVTFTPTDIDNYLTVAGSVTVTVQASFHSFVSDPIYGLAIEDQGFNDDPDGDGLANGLEAFFGTHPGQSSSGLASANSNGTTTTFTHPRNPDLPANLAISYEWSPNLMNWYAGDGVAGPAEGQEVTITSEITSETTTVTAVSTAAQPRIFLRGVVSQN